jgi:hypothetical protein
VSGPSIGHDLHDLRGLFDVSSRRDVSCRRNSYRSRPSRAPPEIAARLALESGVRPMRFQRCICLTASRSGYRAWRTLEASGVTRAGSRCHSTHAILQKLLGYRITRADMGDPPGRCRQDARPVARDSSRAAILVLTRVSFDTGGTPPRGDELHRQLRSLRVHDVGGEIDSICSCLKVTRTQERSLFVKGCLVRPHAATECQ